MKKATSGSFDPGTSGSPKKRSRDMAVMTTQTAARAMTMATITGFGPKRKSARPPTQVATMADSAPMMPNTPTLVTDQFSTSVA